MTRAEYRSALKGRRCYVGMDLSSTKDVTKQTVVSMAPKRQKNPQRDRALTESLHRLLRRLKPPRRPVDGIPLRELRVIGIVQMDIRFLK